MTYNTELAAEGPGLFLRDIQKAEDPHLLGVIGIIAHLQPDILALQSFDYDATGAALKGFVSLLADAGHAMPYSFAARPNTGWMTPFDLDGDGRLGGPRDAQGYGRFAGQGGMALLSTYPILTDDVVDMSRLLWSDLPGNLLPNAQQTDWPSAQVIEHQRLSTTGHWLVPVKIGAQTLTIGTWHATPPVFDGPEDRNGRRNHDETALWLRLFDGQLPYPPPQRPFVLLGDANTDPADGDGRPAAIKALLAHGNLQDTAPQSPGGREAGLDSPHTGDPRHDTVDWPDGEDRPGNLRVSYLLPSRDITVLQSGVFWPTLGTPEADLLGLDGQSSRHRPVWVDIDIGH